MRRELVAKSESKIEVRRNYKKAGRVKVKEVKEIERQYFIENYFKSSFLQWSYLVFTWLWTFFQWTFSVTVPSWLFKISEMFLSVYSYFLFFTFVISFLKKNCGCWEHFFTFFFFSLITKPNISCAMFSIIFPTYFGLEVLWDLGFY